MGLGLVLVGLIAGMVGAVLALIYGAGAWFALLAYIGLGTLGTLATAAVVLLRATRPEPGTDAARIPATSLPQSLGQSPGQHSN